MHGYVEVSPEMTLLVGGRQDAPLPPDPMMIAFSTDDAAPTVSFSPGPEDSDATVVLIIQRSAFERVGGAPIDEACSFHLPSELRAIVLAIIDARTGEMGKVYRLGKSIELLCDTIRLQQGDELVPLAGDSVLSLDDARRIAAARRMIDEHWSEKLTLEIISRACGINRAKLTRGFREMFNCTIAEAIVEKRLNQASLMLRTTDLPVSSIGYENGYLNNASFARAFARRFGLSPSGFRACQMAAA